MERYQDKNLDRSWNRKSRGQGLVNLSGGCWNDYASNFFCCVFQFMIQILNRSWDWSCLSHVNIAGLGGAVVQSTKTAFNGFCRFKGKPGCCSLTEQECSSGNNTRCPHSSFLPRRLWGQKDEQVQEFGTTPSSAAFCSEDQRIRTGVARIQLPLGLEPRVWPNYPVPS